MVGAANRGSRALLLALAVAGTAAATGAAAQTVNVDCARGQTITAALAANPPAKGPLTLLVRGACTEDVFVDAFEASR